MGTLKEKSRVYTLLPQAPYRCRPAEAIFAVTRSFYTHAAPLGLKKKGNTSAINMSPRWG